MNLSKQSSIQIAITPTAGAAGATSINGATIDMQGYDGVLFICQFGAIVSGGVQSVKAQQGQAANLSDAADLAGSAQTVADTDDDKAFYVDIFRPQERYVRLVVPRATQNATCSAVAILYKGSKVPSTHGTGVSGETWISPAEGTA